MAVADGVTINPQRPPPTAFQTSERTRALVIGVAMVVLILEGLDGVLPQGLMLILWWAGAAGVAFATNRIESYMERRRRFSS